jgi:hypothetical protein
MLFLGMNCVSDGEEVVTVRSGSGMAVVVVVAAEVFGDGGEDVRGLGADGRAPFA